MKRILHFIFLTTSFFLYSLGYAWNELGHMVVANIAYQNVNSSTRNKIDYFAKIFNREYPHIHSFPEMVTWPDSIRSQKIETFTHWHYINTPFSKDGTSVTAEIDSDNAEWAIKNIEPIVQNTQANDYERARFLAFLSHIVGDLHQPLHAVTNVSAENPHGDKGGNLYIIRYRNESINLHKLWDDGLGVFDGDISEDRLANLTHSITSLYPPTYFGERIKDLKPEDWIKEEMELAKFFVYSTPEKQTPSEEYLENGKKIAEEQVALGGYRLAYMLNQFMGEVS